MPLYEYRCQSCARDFEALVRPGDTPACPSCGSTGLDRLISAFAVDSAGTRQANRDRSMARGIARQRDREIADKELYDRHHH